jgi:molecular chaperone GrpE
MSERGRSPGSGQGSAPAGSGQGTGGASESIPAQARRPPSAGPASADTDLAGTGSASAEQPSAETAAAQTVAAETGAANEQRIAELEDLRLRALADLDNVRKRCASQVSRAEAESRARVAQQWLPVVDNLERALAHAQADPGSIVDGVQAIRNQAVSVLAQLGYPRRDDDLGAEFDPARHEAIASREDPAVPEGSIVEVVAPAYGEGDRQLRPAQVVVARSS